MIVKCINKNCEFFTTSYVGNCNLILTTYNICKNFMQDEMKPDPKLYNCPDCGVKTRSAT